MPAARPPGGLGQRDLSGPPFPDTSQSV